MMVTMMVVVMMVFMIIVFTTSSRFCKCSHAVSSEWLDSVSTKLVTRARANARRARAAGDGATLLRQAAPHAALLPRRTPDQHAALSG